MNKKLIRAAAAILSAAQIMLLLCGCYDNNEIDSLAQVVALGVEPCGDENIRFTFAVADIGEFSSESDSGAKKSMRSFTAESTDIENAVMSVNSHISKQLNFAHMCIVVASRMAACEYLGDIAEYLERNPDVRPQTLVTVSEISPGEYLENTVTDMEVNPEKYFLNIFQKNRSYIPVMHLSDYTESLYCNTDCIAPVIKKGSSDNEFPTVGAALVHGGKLQSDIAETSMLGLLKSTAAVPIEYNGEIMNVRSVQKPKYEASLDGGHAYIRVHLTVESCDGKFSDSKYISECMEKFLTERSAAGCDVFGFSGITKKKFSDWSEYAAYDPEGSITRTVYDVTTGIANGGGSNDY